MSMKLCFSPGWFLHVDSADAHRGVGLGVDTEPDDGFSTSLQPLLSTVSAKKKFQQHGNA